MHFRHLWHLMKGLLCLHTSCVEGLLRREQTTRRSWRPEDFYSLYWHLSEFGKSKNEGVWKECTLLSIILYKSQLRLASEYASFIAFFLVRLISIPDVCWQTGVKLRVSIECIVVQDPNVVLWIDEVCWRRGILLTWYLMGKANAITSTEICEGKRKRRKERKKARFTTTTSGK